MQPAEDQNLNILRSLIRLSHVWATTRVGCSSCRVLGVVVTDVSLARLVAYGEDDSSSFCSRFHISQMLGPPELLTRSSRCVPIPTSVGKTCRISIGMAPLFSFA